LGFDQDALDSLGGGTPEGDPIVVMVIGVSHELSLSSHEPGWFPMTHPLLDLGKGQADLTQAGEMVKRHRLRFCLDRTVRGRRLGECSQGR
jgi:hypothetical protein